jgi:uncharacterized protein
LINDDDLEITKKKDRILSITHQQDIDGLFCGAILKNAFPDTFVHLTNYGYSNMLQVAKVIQDTISKSRKKGMIIITDLYVDSPEEVSLIEHAALKAKEAGWRFVWLDHHYWKEGIKERVESFAILKISRDQERKCAAELLCETFAIKRTACQRMKKFAHAVDFRTSEITNLPPLPEIIGYYLTLPNAYKKLQRVLNKASKGVFWDDELQEVYESYYLPLKETAMIKAMDSLVVQTIHSYRVAIAESPQILSKGIIAEKIFELQKEADLAILFAPDGKLSIRRAPDSSLRCDLIAQKLNGGGHSYAAGGIIKTKNSDEGEAIKIEIKDVIEGLQKALKQN